MSGKGVCKVEWCEVDAKTRGYCSRHYNQMRRWGEVRRSRGDANEVIERGDYAEIVTYDIDYNESNRFIVDIEDVEKIIHLKWSVRTDGYVSAKDNGVGVKLHRLIAGTPKGMHTDHINLDRLDNRKENLRIVSQAENNKVKGVYSSNTSGHKGVTLLRGKWIAELRYKKKHYYLGSYDNMEDAIEARREGELKYRGSHTINTECEMPESII